jgi:hypothetical protein
VTHTDTGSSPCPSRAVRHALLALELALSIAPPTTARCGSRVKLCVVRAGSGAARGVRWVLLLVFVTTRLSKS